MEIKSRRSRRVFNVGRNSMIAGMSIFGFGALPGDRLATPCGLAGDALGGSGHLLTAI
jgi:hypothetical protein